MAIDKNRNFTCVYCHAPNVGSLDPPASHYLIAERPPSNARTSNDQASLCKFVFVFGRVRLSGPQERSSITQNFFTTASVTVPLPATPVTNAPTTQQRRAFPGHKACTDCHRGQFTTPAIPMCVICHTDVSSNNPPLKEFPASFNEPFNVKFDHAQHNTGAARPQRGCAGCHNAPINRGAGLSIPANLAAHNNCYTCHTPSSKSNAGREIASCGVCHDQKAYRPTSTNARSYRYAFSHADHDARERLACADCHD